MADTAIVVLVAVAGAAFMAVGCLLFLGSGVRDLFKYHVSEQRSMSFGKAAGGIFLTILGATLLLVALILSHLE